MNRIISILIEYALILTGAVLGWLAIGATGSFILWTNEFGQAGGLYALRIILVVGFLVATFRVYHMVKNGKM